MIVHKVDITGTHGLGTLSFAPLCPLWTPELLPSQFSFHSRACSRGGGGGAVLISASWYHRQTAQASQCVKVTPSVRGWKTGCKCATAALLNTPGNHITSTPTGTPWSEQRAHVWQRATPLSHRSHQHHLHIPTQSCVKLDKHRPNETGTLITCH